MGIFSSNKTNVTTIFDVGSSSVGVAVVLLTPNKKPKILHSVRTEMLFQENFHFDRFVASMLDTLDNVSREISAMPIPKYSSRDFLCVFAFPWYASQTRVVKKSFDHRTKIDADFLSEINEKEINAFKQQEKDLMGDEIEILETRSIQIKLNGYETSHPIGKEASEFETAIYISISPEKIIQAVKERIQKHFHFKTLKFSSFSFASFVTLRDIFHEKNFLLMDVSGEVTDVSIIKNNILQETFSFPLGKNFLLRKITTEMGIPLQEAVSQFRMMSDSSLEEKASIKAIRAVEKAGKEWFAELQKMLLTITDQGEILPHDVLLTADENISKWFTKNIQESDTSSFTMASSSFIAKHVNAPFLSGYCETDTAVERDSFLMTEAIYATRVESS